MRADHNTKGSEGGYIVVETIVAFTLFVFLTISILSLINIVAVQARIHYAITQAAETISMYSYTLDAMGVSEHMMQSSKRGEAVSKEIGDFQKNVNGVIDSIEKLNISGIKANGNALYQQGSEVASRVKDDPKDVFQNVMNFGLQKAGSAGFGALVRPLVGRYLGNGSLSGDEYLKAFHVEGGLNGLEFSTFDILGFDTDTFRVTAAPRDDSVLLTSSGDIRIVVSYKIDYTFGVLPLPFRGNNGSKTCLNVTQEVVTKAWLGGNGEGYKP